MNLFQLSYRVDTYMPNSALIITNPAGREYLLDEYGCHCPAGLMGRRCKHVTHLKQLVIDQGEAFYAQAAQLGLSIDKQDRRLLHMGARPENVLRASDMPAYKEFSRLNDKADDLLDTYLAITQQTHKKARAA